MGIEHEHEHDYEGEYNASLPMTCWVTRPRIKPAFVQTPRNGGHVVECGGVPPLLRKREHLSPSNYDADPKRRSTAALQDASEIVPANNVFCNP